MGNFYRHLYPQVHDWDNLLLAWRKARKGKRGLPPAATFEQDAAGNLLISPSTAHPQMRNLLLFGYCAPPDVLPTSQPSAIDFNQAFIIERIISIARVGICTRFIHQLGAHRIAMNIVELLSDKAITEKIHLPKAVLPHLIL